MNEKKQTEANTKSTEKPGLFKKLFTKLDDSMKEKAEAKAQDNCCKGDDGKGGKCC
jgi:hypothetical protein